MANVRYWEQIVGLRYGKLVITKHIGMCNGFRYVEAICDCGGNTKVRLGNIKNGHTKSCGCILEINRRGVGSKSYKHGDCNERLYKIWTGVKSRVLNKRCVAYPNYGGRGIKICAEWLDYNSFKKWAICNGYDKKLTLERILVNGDYEPSNCTWITMSEQNKNRRISLSLEVGGVRRTIKEWGKLYGLKYITLYYRIKRGCPIEEIFLPKKYTDEWLDNRRATA